MAKKRRHSDDLPPEGLWISPGRERFPVVEHLLALQSDPEIFDLPESTRRANVSELRDLAEKLICEGWTRFRYLAGTYAFEVDNARRRWEVIVDILASANAFAGESVAISQTTPLREFQGTVADIYDSRILGLRENPAKNGWRFSQRHRGTSCSGNAARLGPLQ